MSKLEWFLIKWLPKYKGHVYVVDNVLVIKNKAEFYQ